MINTNIKTSFLIGKYFSRLVKESAGGSILFTSAMTGLAPEKGKISYGLSKSSINYIVESLALEGTEINFTANAIAPYILDTPANRSWMGENYDYDTLIKPAEVGELVHSVFLNFHFVSGNVIKLPGRIKLRDDIVGPDFVMLKK
jgi:NAD(P)-dependent dehydrogenase (short-subunit alcohol dehydrogenase family)